MLPFAHNLKRSASSVALWILRSTGGVWTGFDFDMVVSTFGQSLSPGNEQRALGSDAVARQGSRNLVGIGNPAIDKLVDLIISAPDRQSLITRTRALDRVLL